MLSFLEKIKPGFDIAEKKKLRAKRAKIFWDILGVLQGENAQKGVKKGSKNSTKLVRFSGKNRKIAERWKK